MKKTRQQIINMQVSYKFLDGMVDRMVVGYFSHGSISNAFPHKVNAVESLRLRLKQYEKTGNTEFLMDVANYAMIEFMLPAHPNAYFKATDSHESAGFVTNDFEIKKGCTDGLSDASYLKLLEHRKSLKREKN